MTQLELKVKSRYYGTENRLALVADLKTICLEPQHCGEKAAVASLLRQARLGYVRTWGHFTLAVTSAKDHSTVYDFPSTLRGLYQTVSIKSFFPPVTPFICVLKMKAHLLDILSVSLNSTRVEGSYLTWSLADTQSGYEGLWLYFCGKWQCMANSGIHNGIQSSLCPQILAICYMAHVEVTDEVPRT